MLLDFARVYRVDLAIDIGVEELVHLVVIDTHFV